jgi:tungstate transport system ATP-binding protein
MNAHEPLYRLESVEHHYGGRRVLRIGRLDVRAGEAFCLIGPSGAGKSTLLRLLQFLERPSAGSVSFKGQPAGPDLPLAMRRQVTTVFQRPVVLDRSVRANVTYGLRVRGRQDQDEKVDRLLAALGLEHLTAVPARRLSGGEIQRVALARALAFDPEVLLLDEPTANLDPRNVRLVEDLIQTGRTQGVTVVLATHQVFQARRLADRMALLLDGEIVEVGPTNALLDTPRDPRTRAFLNGEMIY